MKKAVSLMLIAAMTVGLTACGSSADDSAAADSSKQENETATDAAGTSTDGDVFVIGGLGTSDRCCSFLRNLRKAGR